MTTRISGGFAAAGVLALTVAAFAQTTGQQSPQPQTQPSVSASAENQVTVTGCVQRESDYRRAHEAGRGGAAGTGMGTGNEFILVDASTSTAAGSGTTQPSTEATGTSGTSSSAAAMAYELTGPSEGDLVQHVGKRVELRGKFKAAETGASGRPTGGATAGAPPSGVDVTSKDLKLREFEVLSVREVSGSCPSISK